LKSYAAWKQQTNGALDAASVVVETARGPIEYAEIGQGPPVLISHGTSGGHDRAFRIAQTLGGERFRLIAPSRPGYLRTPLSVGRTPAEQADAFAALLDGLSVDSAAVIGISGGGPSVLEFALRHPRRCWGIVLVAAVTQPWHRAPRRSPISELAARILATGVGGWLATGAVTLAPEGVVRGLTGASRETALRRLSEIIDPGGRRRAGRRNDLAQFRSLALPPLEGIGCPALVVHGTKDEEVPRGHAEFAARSIPGAKLLWVEGGSHGLFSSRAREVAPEILSFLERHAPSGSHGGPEGEPEIATFSFRLSTFDSFD
jgi:pimeloyl-ACP methyl ester carboxylesterase